MSEPLLSVNEFAIDRVHQCATVVVCIGGRSARLLLGMVPAGAVRWEEVPVELQSHSVVRRRLFELVQRVHDGERIDLPSDLSDVVREVMWTWPCRIEEGFAPRGAHGVFALASCVCREPGVLDVKFEFDGVPSEVVVDVKDAERPALFRFVRGVHPWQVAEGDRMFLLQGLAEAVRSVIGGGPVNV